MTIGNFDLDKIRDKLAGGQKFDIPTEKELPCTKLPAKNQFKNTETTENSPIDNYKSKTSCGVVKVAEPEKRIEE